MTEKEANKLKVELGIQVEKTLKLACRTLDATGQPVTSATVIGTIATMGLDILREITVEAEEE